MRQRTTGLVALGAGVFFLVLAVLLRFYAVPTLEVVPKDYWTHYLATGTGSVFDSRDGSSKQGAALVQDITIKGRTSVDPKQPMPPSDSVIWDYASELYFKTPQACTDTFTKNQCPVSFSNESVAFDNSTAAVKAWGGDRVDTNVTQHGGKQTHPVGSFISKFPFDMAKKDYPLYDSVSGTAPLAKYSGTADVDGVTAYKYVQVIGGAAPVKLYDETKLPPSLVGDIGPDGTPIPVWYSSTTTVWVEPVSGIPLKGDQHISLTAGSATNPADTNRLTLLDVDLTLDKVQKTDTNGRPQFADSAPIWVDYTQQAVRDAKAADRISLIKDTLPLISLILGLLLLLGGVFLTVRSNAAGTGADPGAEREPNTPSSSAEAEEEEPTKVIPAVAEDEPVPPAAETHPSTAETKE